MHDLFISYSHEDGTPAAAVAKACEAAGWRVWWDRNLVAGKLWDESIEITLELPSTGVPNLAGKTPEQTTAILRQERLRLGWKTDGDAQNKRRSSVLYDQQPKAGTPVRVDERVNVTRIPPPVV